MRRRPDFNSAESMMAKRWFLFLVIAFFLFVAGCGGDLKPVNEGLDRPIQAPQKDKVKDPEKDKEKGK
jgi:hypothetical protein